MLEKKTVSLCIISDYCRGWNDAVDAMSRWISVEEGLPEFDIDVLVCATGDFGSVITITSYSDHLHGFNIKGWVSPWQYFHKNYTITHWMPLPQPPEEPA